MKKYYAVARWELLEKIKTKAFLFGLFFTPLIILLFNIVPALLMNEAEEVSLSFVVVDKVGGIYQPLKDSLENKYLKKDKSKLYNIIDSEFPISDTVIYKTILNKKISTDEIDAYFVINKIIKNEIRIDYYAKQIGLGKDQSRIENLVREIIFYQRLKSEGYPYEKIESLKPKSNLVSYKISDEGKSDEASFLSIFFTGYIFVILFMILCLSTGQMLVRSVVEEKSNRLIEVLLSSCSSKDLLIGKILGLSALGLTTISVWVVIGLIAVIAFNTFSFSLGLISVLLISIYFIIGYIFFSSIFVALGSSMTTEQEAQQMTGYASMLMVLPIAFLVPMMQNPDSQIAKILSFVPIFTPTFMILRISIKMPEVWEIILSLVILISSTFGMMIVASKIFRIGILITGKRPTFKELFKWIKIKNN